MSENSGKRRNNRCAIFGTAGSYGKPRYFESLERSKAVIDELIKRGINTFVTDARDGFDLDLSVYIQELKINNPNIHLVVVRPYPGFNSNWDTKPILQSVMDKADMLKYMAEDEGGYSPNELNEWIISHCDTVLYIKRSKNATINRISTIDLSDKSVIYIPDMPPVKEQGVSNSPKTEVYPYNLIAAISNVDYENIDPHDYSDDIEEKVHAALEYCLKEREIFVMEERYIEGKKFQEIGDTLGLTRERILQLINKSLRKLRYYNKWNGLLSGIETENGALVSNAGQKWTPGEEKLLLERYNQGLSIEEIAELHGRGKGGIRSRLRKLGIDPDELPYDMDEKPESEPISASASGSGLNVNEIIVAAVQVPGKASFENYDELKSYLKTGLESYNSTVYSLDNIEQARHDHFVLKSVKKKLTDTKKAIQKEYSLPIELVVQQLDELISMVNGPYSSIDRMLKVNAKEIKRHDIMNYAQSRAAVLGKYAGSVLQSPSFFNPRWCNASYYDSRWKKDVDQIIASAKDSIQYILDTGFDDVGIIFGYYFDKLSLDGIDAFLYNVKKEEPKRQPDTVYIDVNTGEIVDQTDERPVVESQGTTEQKIEVIPDSDNVNENDSADEKSFSESQQSDTYDPKHEPSEDIVRRQVMLSGTKEQIDKYLASAQQFDVSIDEIDQM